MKKTTEVNEEEHELEIHKAVAQAWHGRSGNSKPIIEFEAYRDRYKCRPTRFRREAMNKLSSSKESGAAAHNNWDFGQSLWDSYEIVNLSKRLETGLMLETSINHATLEDMRPKSSYNKRRRESKNSLRNLLHRMSSSKRFGDADIPHEEDDHDQF
ncbi:uncharacterized protein LOC113291154 [Papaver somniferum]|uniref:uncharacterized protein LOC113291154 n=1 Tax=Papaver somniferum TaxID=3469 RepID=UPI000E6FFBD0|nr:uncharacterized protein LOC113291154 [Papaver somniferum]